MLPAVPLLSLHGRPGPRQQKKRRGDEQLNRVRTLDLVWPADSARLSNDCRDQRTLLPPAALGAHWSLIQPGIEAHDDGLTDEIRPHLPRHPR